MASWASVFVRLVFFGTLASSANAQDSDPLGDLAIPGITSYAPSQRTIPLTDQAAAGELLLDARLTTEGDFVTDGMVWRIYNATAKPGQDALELVATARGGGGQFLLDPGDYIVHAAFGRAGATTRITVGTEPMRQTLVLDAGGLKLDATLPDVKITRSDWLSFDVFSIEEATGEHTLVLPEVPAGQLVRLPSGTYHIVSHYGDHNAEIRADLRVEAGRTTEATIQHRAAFVEFELVRQAGGVALADTAWSILSPTNETILEHAGPSPNGVLAAGTYTVVVQHRDQVYQRDVTVTAGADKKIEILASQIAAGDSVTQSSNN